jgi:prepilin-type N-terminal cleavage/methylation domain-containing protein
VFYLNQHFPMPFCAQDAYFPQTAPTVFRSAFKTVSQPFWVFLPIPRVNDCLSFGPHNGEVVNRCGVPLQKTHHQGFTLIEMSIVLVVIGLIIGGILVGQSLIAAAAVRAQITQIEKFNTAASTFFEKYRYLPGDIPQAAVTQFGFTVVPTRAGTAGRGDGNGIVEGYLYNAPGVFDPVTAAGETAFFWEDLSANSNLIEGGFNTAVDGDVGSYIPATVLPAAKLGTGNFVYVYAANSRNYFGVSNIGIIAVGMAYPSGNNPGVTVQQAYAVDAKVDDGLPQTGNVTANYQNWDLFANYVNGAVWAAGGGVAGASGTAATAGSSTTCYDNSSSATGTPGISGAVQHYSVEISNGANSNCALSFRMQAGDR